MVEIIGPSVHTGQDIPTVDSVQFIIILLLDLKAKLHLINDFERRSV